MIPWQLALLFLGYVFIFPGLMKFISLLKYGIQLEGGMVTIFSPKTAEQEA